MSEPAYDEQRLMTLLKRVFPEGYEWQNLDGTTLPPIGEKDQPIFTDLDLGILGEYEDVTVTLPPQAIIVNIMRKIEEAQYLTADEAEFLNQVLVRPDTVDDSVYEAMAAHGWLSEPYEEMVHVGLHGSTGTGRVTTRTLLPAFLDSPKMSQVGVDIAISELTGEESYTFADHLRLNEQWDWRSPEQRQAMERGGIMLGDLNLTGPIDPYAVMTYGHIQQEAELRAAGATESTHYQLALLKNRIEILQAVSGQSDEMKDWINTTNQLSLNLTDEQAEVGKKLDELWDKIIATEDISDKDIDYWVKQWAKETGLGDMTLTSMNQLLDRYFMDGTINFRMPSQPGDRATNPLAWIGNDQIGNPFTDHRRLQTIWDNLHKSQMREDGTSIVTDLGLDNPADPLDQMAFMKWLSVPGTDTTGDPGDPFSPWSEARRIIEQEYMFSPGGEGMPDVAEREKQAAVNEFQRNSEIVFYAIEAAGQYRLDWQAVASLAHYLSDGGQNPPEEDIHGWVDGLAYQLEQSIKRHRGDLSLAFLEIKEGRDEVALIQQYGLPSQDRMPEIIDFFQQVSTMATAWGLDEPELTDRTNMLQTARATLSTIDPLAWEDQVVRMWEQFYFRAPTAEELSALKKLPALTAAETARKFGWAGVPQSGEEAADWFGYQSSVEAKLRRFFRENPQYQELYGLKPASMTEEEWLAKFSQSGVPGMVHSEQARQVGMTTGSRTAAWREDLLNPEVVEETPTLRGRLARLSMALRQGSR